MSGTRLPLLVRTFEPFVIVTLPTSRTFPVKVHARKGNPLMSDLLQPLQYYWVTAQSEYSTDILFNSSAQLSELYPRLLSHSTSCFAPRK